MQRTTIKHRWEDMPRERVNEHLERRLVTGDRMMLAHVYIKKGCVVPQHSHENEQLTYILEGALKFWIGEVPSESNSISPRSPAISRWVRNVGGGYAQAPEMCDSAPELWLRMTRP